MLRWTSQVLWLYVQEAWVNGYVILEKGWIPVTLGLEQWLMKEVATSLHTTSYV